MKNLQYLTLGLAIIIFLAMAFHFWGWPLDDAFEENVYAKNLVQGHGFVFNVGEEKIEGYACLLWILLLAAAIMLNLNIVLAANVMGVTFGILAILMLYKLSLLVSGNKKYAAYPPLFLASMPAFAIWATSGVETALFIFLLITALYFFIKEEKQGRGYLSAVFFLLLALTRHEGGIVFLASLVFRGIKHYRSLTTDREYLKKQAIWAAIVIIPYSLYTIWRLFYFGDLFPNPFYAKSSLSPVYGNISAMAVFMSYLAPFIILGILGIIDKKLTTAQKYLIFIGSVMLILVWRIGGWYWAYRYAVPIIPIILVFSQFELERLFSAAKKESVLKKALAVLVPALLLFYAIYPLAMFENQVEYGASGSRGTQTNYANWFNEYYPNVTLAFGDIGIIRYYTNLTLIDVAGLNNRYIAHHGFSVDYIIQMKPEFVILISQTEDNFTSLNDPRNEYIALYNSKEFHDHYTLVFKSYVVSGYYYWTYIRNDLTISQEALANHP